MYIPKHFEERDLAVLHALSDLHESERVVPWSVSDAPHDYIDTLLERIVGIEIPIGKLVGKWKTSQNRQPADKLGGIAGLQERGDAASTEMAALVQPHVDAGQR